MYEYEAEVVKIVDADTVDLSVDLGFKVYHTIRVRLAGIDAPERFTDEGKEATAWLTNYMPIGTRLIVQTKKDKAGKYGRYIATLILDGTSVNEKLVKAGHAVEVDYD